MGIIVGAVGGISPLMQNKVLGVTRAFLDSVFSAYWYQVSGTEMLDLFGGPSLTLSSDPGQTYIPAAYAGTITAPDVAAYKTDDVNNVLYDGIGTPQALSVSDFIDADLPSIPVKYDNLSPHHIRAIGLFDSTVYGSLTTSQKKIISDYMNLWVFYWGVWYDAGSVNKENRTF